MTLSANYAQLPSAPCIEKLATEGEKKLRTPKKIAQELGVVFEKVSWKEWRPYLSEWQGGTVDEDYSAGVTSGISSPTKRKSSLCKRFLIALSKERTMVRSRVSWSLNERCAATQPDVVSTRR